MIICHSISIRTVSSQRLLSTLLIQFKLKSLASLVQTTLWAVWAEQHAQDTTTDQPGRKRRYHYIREARSLLSQYIYCIICPLHWWLLLCKSINTTHKKVKSKKSFHQNNNQYVITYRLQWALFSLFGFAKRTSSKIYSDQNEDLRLLLIQLYFPE